MRALLDVPDVPDEPRELAKEKLNVYIREKQHSRGGYDTRSSALNSPSIQSRNSLSSPVSSQKIQSRNSLASPLTYQANAMHNVSTRLTKGRYSTLNDKSKKNETAKFPTLISDSAKLILRNKLTQQIKKEPRSSVMANPQQQQGRFEPKWEHYEIMKQRWKVIEEDLKQLR
jgi:hypothetical protein